MNINFWKGKKVLITGHTGFKGSWLSLWLQKKGADVVGYSLPPPTKPSIFDVANVSAGMETITGDVRNLEHLIDVISKHQPQIIVHMAAQSLVQYSYNNPVDTYAVNVMGTVNLLEAARLVRCAKVIVIVTSDKCYENKEWIWGYRENDPMGGYDPYSSSKGCAELVTSAYSSSYFSKKDQLLHDISVASVRAGNVIGGGDWAENRLIPDIMKACMGNRSVFIRNPDAIRPWQHVLEPLHGYMRLIECLWERGSEFSGAWNFGPNDGEVKPVSIVTDILVKLWGEGMRWELDRGVYSHEAHYLKLDSSKARNLLGWSPRLNLFETLKFTVTWYKNYQQNENMRNVTDADIERYENISHFTDKI